MQSEGCLARDVRHDAAAAVEPRVPAGEGVLDLRDVPATVGETDWLRRLRSDTVLVPGDLPGEGEHELARDPGERDDRDERCAERARHPLDGPQEKARVEE